jgi:cytochrome b561
MSFSLLVAATLASGLLIGLIPTLVDGVQRPLQARLKLSERRVEWFARLFYLAWLPAMPLAGWLLDAGHNKETLFFGMVALILGIA